MRELEGRRDSGASEFFVVVAVAVVLLSTGLAAWAATVWWLRRYAFSRWWPALAAAVAGAVVALLGMVQGTPGRLLVAVEAVEVSTSSVGSVLAAGAGLLGRVALATAPVAVPLGLAAAALTPPPEVELPGSRSLALQRRDARRAKREMTRVDQLAAAPPPTTSAPAAPSRPVLGVVAGPGDLPPGWVEGGKWLVLPTRAAGLPRLVIGRPGQGKSVYLCREVELAGHDRRQTVVVDCKGEPGFADEVEAAYRAGWTTRDASSVPTVHRWPDEPLNAWTGGPTAVADRLLSVWTFDTAALWYREVVDLALTLALHAPGPPVTSSRELLARIQRGRLAELWEGSKEEAALVASIQGKDKLDDVCIRLGNLLSKLGGLLDGADPIGARDLTILSLPTMAQEHHAASILRVTLADLAHYVSTRKPAARRLLAVVDEFSAIVGARDHAIHLAERGRSANAATVLAVQSARGLGDDDDADRLIGSAGMVAVFGTAEPERILKLAGTVEKARHSLSVGDYGDTHTYSEAHEYRVDANDVRALDPGYAYVLASGRAQRIKVIRPRAGDGPLPSAAPPGDPDPGRVPARAVDGRGVPAPPAPRQEPSVPPGRPAAALDPPPAPQVRRHRPPQVGLGSPPDARMPEEVVPEP